MKNGALVEGGGYLSSVYGLGENMGTRENGDPKVLGMSRVYHSRSATDISTHYQEWISPV